MLHNELPVLFIYHCNDCLEESFYPALFLKPLSLSCTLSFFSSAEQTTTATLTVVVVVLLMILEVFVFKKKIK